MAKKVLIRKTQSLFRYLKNQHYFQKIKKSPHPVRYSLSGVLILIGVLGFIFPALPGFPILIAGISLLVGLRRMEGWLIRTIHFLRLHIVFGKIYTWWHKK